MMENNRRQEGTHLQSLENDKLDRELDAALAKYAAIEPRLGIEERVLANLRAEPGPVTSHSWWRWPAVGALAAVIVVIASVAWRSGKPVQSKTTRPPAMAATARDSATHVAHDNGTGAIRQHKTGSRRQADTPAVTRETTVVAPSPKLDHFPSPQPLSEQEAILARYVTSYPEHAALIAQARTDALRQDHAEEMREAASPQDSRQ
jgi:hypothetical protein